jgi:drug/metabolite transporter (DMT)-like permease
MGAAIGTAYVLIFVCNQRSGPNVTAMVQPAMPICTTLLSAALGLEKVSVGKAVGLAVATVGTATTLRVLEIEQGASLLDAVLLLTQANAYAVYVVLLTLALKSLDAQLRADLLKKKKEKEKETELVRERSDDVRSSVASSKKVAAPPGPMRFLFAATVVAEVGVAAIAAEDLVENIEWASLPPVAWGAVLYAGLASSCLAHGLNSWAISKVQGILPTVYSGVQVVFTVLFAYAFLGHPVGWDRAAGSAVTVFGVYLVSRAKFHEQHRKTSEEDDASVSDDASEMHLRVRRTSVDHIAVAVELGPAENKGVSRRNSTGLPPVASASELEAAARAEEEQEAHRARSLV